MPKWLSICCRRTTSGQPANPIASSGVCFTTRHPLSMYSHSFPNPSTFCRCPRPAATSASAKVFPEFCFFLAGWGLRLLLQQRFLLLLSFADCQQIIGSRRRLLGVQKLIHKPLFTVSLCRELFGKSLQFFFWAKLLTIVFCTSSTTFPTSKHSAYRINTNNYTGNCRGGLRINSRKPKMSDDDQQLNGFEHTHTHCTQPHTRTPLCWKSGAAAGGEENKKPKNAHTHCLLALAAV